MNRNKSLSSCVEGWFFWVGMLFSVLIFPLSLLAQPSRTNFNFPSPCGEGWGGVYTLQVRSSSDPLGMPVIALGGDEWVDIDFDLLTHEYQRLTYRIEHCNYDWTPTEGLFDSDYLEGFDGQPIDDYEKSFNTSVLYTHYHLRLPNDDVAMRLSGNYRVKILDEDERVIAEACFMVVEPAVSISAQMTTRTDLDINNRHQQIEYEVGYAALDIVDPLTELRTVVIQNRRWDNRVVNPEPNIQSVSSIAFTHNRPLIFPAGAECHKFEFTDKTRSAMGVDHVEYHAPYEHVVLEPVVPARSYDYDEDFNGAFVIRDRYDEAPDTRAEYVFVHFALQCDPLPPGHRVFVQGDLTHGQLLPQFEMQYNPDWGGYELAALLKQGYYEYRYVHLPPGDDGQLPLSSQSASQQPAVADVQRPALTSLAEGDFYETRNEYAILVYHRARAARYDRLVGISRLARLPE